MEACQENRRVVIAAACMPLQIPPKSKTRTAPRPVRPSGWHAAATAALVLAATMAHAQLPSSPQAHGRARAHADAIRKVDFRAYLLARGGLGKQLAEEFGERDPIRHITVQYADLLGHGDEQAIVEATTCAMGNGGADITEVFRRLPDGGLASLPLDDTGYQDGNLYEGQRRTPRLEVRHGRLTRWFVRYGEGPEGGAPQIRRTIIYRWSRDRFVIDSVKDDAIGDSSPGTAPRRATVPPG
ncbi:hypothetical protein C8238_07935 [Paracidovorax avenae]|nr:hypothetical protein C8238_07935 [Paracidovorax avenae]